MCPETLTRQLSRIDAVRFGEFKLKSGSISPLYLDLRLSISHPTVLRSIAEGMLQVTQHLDYDCLCGVPYTALPFATAMSLGTDKPMVMRRKEAKNYGLKKLIEGSFQPGQRCLVVEDLVSSGSSVFETIRPLEEAGLIVEDVVVLVDREQGARKRLEEEGYHLHSVLKVSEMLKHLLASGDICEETFHTVNNYLIENQLEPVVSI